jgi:hypothetical protein
VFLEKYKTKHATKKIPIRIGDIHPARVNKKAITAKRPVIKRKTLFERTGSAKRSATSTMAGLRKRIAGFQAMNEFGNLMGKDARRSRARAITAKDA